MLRYLLSLLLLLTFTFSAYCQTSPDKKEDIALGRTLRVGVEITPPYAIQDQTKNLTGLAIRLWRQIAEAEHFDYNLIPLQPRDSSVLQIENGNLDVILYVSASAANEKRIDLTQSYHQTRLGIAMPQRNSFLQIAKGLFTLKFLYIVLALCALLFVVSIIFWLLEKDHNEDDFGGERTWIEGIGASFWWAGVTLTTIGYGDKAPSSVGGRMVAMLWMLLSLFVTATLTATMVGLFSAKQTVSFPDGLEKEKVGVLADTPAATFLKSKNISFQTYPDALTGLKDVGNEKLDYFIHNTSSLRHLKRNHKSIAINIQSTNAAPQAFTIGLPTGSPLRETIQQRIQEYTLSENWFTILEEYDLEQD